MTDHISGEQISAWVDGELDSSDYRDAEAHLRDCAVCRAVYEEMASVTKLFGTAESLEAPPYLWRRILEALEAWSRHSTKPAVPYWSGLRAKVLATAAGLVIIVGGALGYYASRTEYVARQVALRELDQVGKSLSTRFPDNPFRIASATSKPNPFSKLKTGEDVNPFSSLIRH